MALWLGDHTAKYEGRLTLNPLKHIDPIGTILLPIILIKTGAPIIFGWAKPVPINYWGLRNPKKDIILVGLAGPLANIILAALLVIIMKSFITTYNLAYLILENAIMTNLFLAVFNLMPIPPLDGSRVLFGCLPKKLANQYASLEKYGFLILIGVMFLLPNFLDWSVRPIVRILAGLLNLNF